MEWRVTLFCLLASLPLCYAKTDDLDQTWADFKRTHLKFYHTDDEEIYRRQVWEDNLSYIHHHNLRHDVGEYSYFLGMNEYCDLTHGEFVKQMNGLRRMSSADKSPNPEFEAPSNFTPPTSVDWRQHGYVTRVKNQGRCGSCWAFSVTGALEGQFFKSSKKLVPLSEQQLVDCDKNNGGCFGGLMDTAFLYVKHNEGLATEDDYPYLAVKGSCRKISSLVANCSGYVDVKHGEVNLQAAVATIGPISVGIDAGHRSFQHYRGGVYDEPECSSKILDHGVLAVGYGQEKDGSKYWLVKNSWGMTWGSQGYLKMSRDKNNQCGIASQSSYPIV